MLITSDEPIHPSRIKHQTNKKRPNLEMLPPSGNLGFGGVEREHLRTVNDQASPAFSKQGGLSLEKFTPSLKGGGETVKLPTAYDMQGTDELA